MPRPGPSVTSGADLQPGSDSLFPSGFTGGGARPSAGSVGTGEIADGSVAAADLNLASVTAALNNTYAQAGFSPFLTGTGYTPTRRYNPNSGLYGLTGANWKYARNALAKARAGTGLCRIGVVGDSITAGYHATTQSTDSWPDVMREYMTQLGYPAAGTGDVLAGVNGVWSASSPDPRWTGNWTNVAFPNNSGGFGISSAASGKVQTFTTNKAGTIAEFSYGRQTAWTGTFTVEVKNSSGTSLSGPTAYSTSAATAVTTVSLTGLTLDVGSQIIFTSTNTGVNVVFSAGVRNATGVLVSKLGIGTASTSTWDSFTGSTTGFNSGYFAKALLSSVDILLIALGCNDATNASSGTTPSAFATNLADIVANLKTATTSAALIHPIPGSNGGTAFWGSSVGGFTSATFYQAADALGLPMLDLSDRWQDYASANTGGLMFDTIHPNTPGYQRIGLDVATGLLVV